MNYALPVLFFISLGMLIFFYPLKIPTGLSVIKLLPRVKIRNRETFRKNIVPKEQ